ncbi:response regulator transcription factor [Actinoplanes sp. CA-054009]
MEPIRTLIVDDHAAFREGLRALLETSEDIEVADDAASGEQALVMAPRLQPDVVLIDLAMPGIGGVAATERLVRAMPQVRVLVLSTADDDDSVFAAVRAGARGSVLKGARKAELLRAVRTVAGGEAVFGAALAVRLMGYFSTPEGRPELSDRERQILGLAALHLGSPQIARRLGLSEQAVRAHVSSIFAKLRAREAGPEDTAL